MRTVSVVIQEFERCNSSHVPMALALEVLAHLKAHERLVQALYETEFDDDYVQGNTAVNYLQAVFEGKEVA